MTEETEALLSFVEEHHDVPAKSLRTIVRALHTSEQYMDDAQLHRLEKIEREERLKLGKLLKN